MFKRLHETEKDSGRAARRRARILFVRTTERARGRERERGKREPRWLYGSSRRGKGYSCIFRILMSSLLLLPKRRRSLSIDFFSSLPSARFLSSFFHLLSLRFFLSSFGDGRLDRGTHFALGRFCTFLEIIMCTNIAICADVNR